MGLSRKNVYVVFDEEYEKQTLIGIFSTKRKANLFLKKYPAGLEANSDLSIVKVRLDEFDNLLSPPDGVQLYRVWHMNKDGVFISDNPVDRVDFFVGWEDKVGEIESGREWGGEPHKIIGDTLIVMVLAKNEQDAAKQADDIRIRLIEGGKWNEDRRILY
jgi:hypothetical protein